MTRIRTLLLTGGAGALLAYLFDPDRGKGRRDRIAMKLGRWTRVTADRSDKMTRYAAGQAKGFRHKIDSVGSTDTFEGNDPALVQKIRSEMFIGLDDVDSGAINIDVADGVATLRGEVAGPGVVAELESRARKVTGVVDVVNLLHPPGEEPANVRDALDASR